MSDNKNIVELKNEILSRVLDDRKDFELNLSSIHVTNIFNKEIKVDENRLKKVAIEEFEDNPNISDEELEIKLLKVVAEDKKHRRMAKIARRILKRKMRE